jgi:hypothetical protein
MRYDGEITVVSQPSICANNSNSNNNAAAFGVSPNYPSSVRSVEGTEAMTMSPPSTAIASAQTKPSTAIVPAQTSQAIVTTDAATTQVVRLLGPHRPTRKKSKKWKSVANE